MYVYIYRNRICPTWGLDEAGLHIGLFTILPLPILYGVYCNKGGSGGNNLLRNSVGDEVGGVGCLNRRGVCKE